MKYELPDEMTVAVDGPVRIVTLNRPGELGWITTFLDDPVARDESIREGAQIIEEMLRFPLPVIAAVNGPAVGLGCSVAVLCDIALISREYLYTDDRIPASVAVELGLASRTVAPDELLPEARKLAARLTGQLAEALRGTKRVVNMFLSQILGGPLQAGFAAEQITMQSDDHRERLLDIQRKSKRS